MREATEGPAPAAATGARRAEAAVAVKAITVQTGRLVCDVVIPRERFRYTTPRVAAFVEGQFPDLPHHACVNDRGKTFGSVIESTSTPHLLEHLAISIETREAAGSAASFVGTSEWTDENAGEARISLSFRDDLEALRAFNKAVEFLNIAVLTCLS